MGRPFGSHIWPVSMLVEVMSNGNGFHGLMCFDIVLRYQKTKNQHTLTNGPLKRKIIITPPSSLPLLTLASSPQHQLRWVVFNHGYPMVTASLNKGQNKCHAWQPWVPHVGRMRLLELHG